MIRKTLAGVTFALASVGCAAPDGNRVAPPVEATAPVRRPDRSVIYCADMEWTVTDIHCVGAVPETAVSHREQTLALTRENGKVVMVDVLPRNRGIQVARWELRYDGDEIREERVFTGTGVLIVHGVYERGGTFERLFDETGKPLVSKRGETELGRYQGLELDRDAKGFIVERRFVDGSGKPAVNDDGAHVIRYVRDAGGAELETRAFDVAGRPVGQLDGAHRRVKKLDADGRVVRLERYDADGRPFAGAWIGAVEERTYDGWGNAVLDRQLDADGRVLRVLKKGRDADGLLARQSFSDASGAPIENSRGAADMVFTYDERRLLKSIESFDREGKPKLVSTFGFDDKGRQTSSRWRNHLGEPIGGFDYERDEYDRSTRNTRWLGPGRLGETFSIRYDERGRPVERRHLDVKGHIDDTQQCPLLRYTYEEDGADPELSCRLRSGRLVDIIVFRTLATTSRPRADAALARIRAGERFRDVEAAFDHDAPFDDKPFEERLLRADHNKQDAFWGALAAAQVGQVVGIVELSGRFMIGVRER